MKRRVGTVRPNSFWESESDFAVKYPVEDRVIASFIRHAALRSVWTSIIWSSERFFTHFKRTFTIVRWCWKLYWADFMNERIKFFPKFMSIIVWVCFCIMHVLVLVQADFYMPVLIAE